MHILLGVIAAPAFVFFVFALALGLNPVKSAAWGAILGMAALVCFALQVSMAEVSRFQTRMAWDGTGNGHWDVVLSGMVDERMRLLATIPLDEWISLGATQCVLELHDEGEEVLKPTACPELRLAVGALR